MKKNKNILNIVFMVSKRLIQLPFYILYFLSGMMLVKYEKKELEKVMNERERRNER